MPSLAQTTRRAQPAAKPSANREARQRLLGEHIGLVYHVARQLCRAKQIDIEIDELVSAGALGLIEAFEKFDPGRGLAFSTFAAPRIRGAMLDELRRQDHVPRSVRRRARELNTALDALTRMLGQSPDQDQLARTLGIDARTLVRWQAEGDGGRFIPLDRTSEGTREGSSASVEHLLSSDPGIDEAITATQEVARLRDALVALPEQERVVLSLYYFEELKLVEIAGILEVSESRVSQIRAKAVGRLRTMLGSLRESAA
jgi:RNA polymerase sigma factor for flagellar operon FliA